MAQNPDERFATAADFRDALRRLGRVEGSVFEWEPPQSETESASVQTGETTVVKSGGMISPRKIGQHAIVTIFVVLLVAFGVFCHYYPWKLPAAAIQESVGRYSPNDPPMVVRSATIEGSRSNQTGNQKSSPGRKRIS
jgi:hypothetical protein